jgi:membrane fusion protein (multidrug efflux system)
MLDSPDGFLAPLPTSPALPQRKERRLLKRVLLLLLLALLVFGGLAGAKVLQVRRMIAKFSAPQPPAPIAVVNAERMRWERSLFAVGSLSAVQDVVVTTEVPGLVATLRFESGQHVRAGDVLVTLDSSVDLAELAGLEASEELARLQYARFSKLVRDRTASEAQYDEAAAQRRQATALVAAKRAYIAKKTVRAPIDGVLGLRRVDLGDYLAPGTEVVSLQALDEVFVDYRLPERLLGRLALDQPLRVRVQAWPGRDFAGRITAIDPAIDVATRMVRVRGKLDNPDHALRPGMFTDVDTLESTPDEVVAVPETAITYTPYGNSVYVVVETPQGLVVRRRQVETGAVRDGLVAVSTGLEAGERVVAVGQNKLRNEQAVQIAEAAAPADTVRPATQP